jgi:hypothetical protein
MHIVTKDEQRPTQVRYPESIGLDRYGNIYVGDGGNHRIQKLSAEGVLLRQWEGPPGTIYFPDMLAVDPEGLVYFDAGIGHGIHRISPEGEALGRWPARSMDGVPIWGCRGDRARRPGVRVRDGHSG